MGDHEVPLPKPPCCREIKVDEETYTGCAYGYGDVHPLIHLVTVQCATAVVWNRGTIQTSLIMRGPCSN